MRDLRRAIYSSLFLLIVAATLVSADDDPPGRVARLQYISGSVSVQSHGTDEWVAGSLNRPLTTSDNIWVDKDSRIELGVGTGLLRADDETSLTLTNVSDNAVQIQLNQGTLNLRVRKLYGSEIYEIDTPNVAFTVQKAGEYRIDVPADGDATIVTVWKGEGDATGNGPSVRVHSNHTARFSGGTSMAHDIYKAPDFDGFDDWCRVRDQRQDHSTSAQYVAPGTIGYEDLDDYGYWQVVPTYGRIWVPRTVAAGWAPYRYGHWVWVSPWGWTWVDDAPWGFAPFHYGRWVYYSGYWGWAPGPVYVRPVYAPALVAWFGGGGFSFGVSFGGGGYGWCPLGYGEPYIPWYRGSRGYFRQVNVTNTHITNITYVTNNYYNYGNGDSGRTHVKAFDYANLKAPGGITAVESRTIVDSRPVAKSLVPVNAKDVASLNSSHLEGRLAEPTRESRLGNDTQGRTIVPPTRPVARPVVTRNPVPAVGRTDARQEVNGRGTPAAPTADRSVANDSGPHSPSRVIPRPPTVKNKGDEPVARTDGNGTRTVGASGSAEAKEIEPTIGRAVPRPPTSHRDDAGPAASSPVTRTDMPQNDDRKPVYSASPVGRPVPRPTAPVESQPTVEQHSAPSGSGNAVPRPSGPVSTPHVDRGAEDRTPRYTPAPPPSATPHQVEPPRQNTPSMSPAPSRPSMDAPRQNAPASNPTPHVSPAPSAPAGRSTPPAQNAPSAPPRNNWRG